MVKKRYNGPWSYKDSRWTPELLKKAGHTKANDGAFFLPFKNFLSKPYFRRTDVAIYKDFASTHTYPVTQKTQDLKIKINIPNTQVVYFTVEMLNKRFKKNCNWKRYSVGIYFLKGTYYSNKNLITTGFLGWSHHHTTGKPDVATPAGTYTLNIYNWNYPKSDSIEYQVTVYQEGTDKVTLSY